MDPEPSSRSSPTSLDSAGDEGAASRAQALQPGAVIYLENLAPVNPGKCKANRQPYYVNNDRVADYNAIFPRLADASLAATSSGMPSSCLTCQRLPPGASSVALPKNR